MGLAAQLAFRADLARDTRYFRCERAKLIDHRIDRVLELQNFTLNIHGDFLREVSVGDSRGDFRDISDLRRQIAGHEIHIISQVFPGACHALDFGLSAQLAFRADFARHARHFRREGGKLIDHRVDRVLEFQNLTLHIDGDLL